MKKLLVFTCLTLATYTASAQFDSNTGSISVPRSNTTTPNTTPSASTVAPLNFDTPKTPTNAYQVGGSDNSWSMYQEDKYVSRSSEYADRTEIKRGGESNEAFKGNIDFGVLRTKSAYLRLMASDFGLQDGDRVKVTNNGKIIASDVILTNSGVAIMITLNEGFNNLHIEALNQGTVGPNTADFGLVDDKDQVISRNQWNLATGFYAKFVVVKE